MYSSSLRLPITVNELVDLVRLRQRRRISNNCLLLFCARAYHCNGNSLYSSLYDIAALKFSGWILAAEVQLR
ncbi:hypothetical protein JTE90_028211 [Oedothorax gibbosus]|uniref:Uncharacterized protein n=1 Tax=Oedothorax gibbosus TaxID=931172 RepID=A0AAV6U0V3_9ARAC|nr:hypothetical protein JTE90_028211 [Oedothorax gibbosus]